MGGHAWVTLATNDSYSLGALVLAHSLKKANTVHKLAVLVTPAVSLQMREQLETVFDLVKVVDVLDSKDEAHLALMKRPELGVTFTKIHCWRLTEFDKCVFLDADTLVVRNCDELFEREEFSAAPDVGWPDCFNSGVFVYKPSLETFDKLIQFAMERGSFDGGDQGLLNQFFRDWATEDIKKHLPFVYNLTTVAFYSYIPAFKQYGSDTRIVHFIGTEKPWHQQLDPETKTISPTSGSEHMAPLLQKWWDLFCEKVHPNLSKRLENSNGMSHLPLEGCCSNSNAVECCDEPELPHFFQPPTSYIEKNDFRQISLPYQPFDVKGSSGELLNLEFFVATAVSPDCEIEEKQQWPAQNTQEVIVKESEWENNQNHEKIEENYKQNKEKESGEDRNRETEGFERNNEEPFENKKQGCEYKNVEEEIQSASNDQQKCEEQGRSSEKEQEECQGEERNSEEKAISPENPFNHDTFFPDDVCVNNYLEQNIINYQPFDHRSRSPPSTNHENGATSATVITNQNEKHDDIKPDQQVQLLPRFLTIPENDARQSGNCATFSSSVQSHTELCRDMEKSNGKSIAEENSARPTSNEVDWISTKSNAEFDSVDNSSEVEIAPKENESLKTKSSTNLVFDANTIRTSSLPSSGPLWTFRSNVTTDIGRKYSMPKLKPLLPRQNYFYKSTFSIVPKVTYHTEFLMSSDYQDPVDLPKDKVGFVETHILREAHLKRSKSDGMTRNKFGPLPYVFTAERETPENLKLLRKPLRHSTDSGLYDLKNCKRQIGNKPKPKENWSRKENSLGMPVLRPLLPSTDSNYLTKKRKRVISENEEKDKPVRKPKKSGKQQKRERKTMPSTIVRKPNASERITDNVGEILKRLFEYSKNYLHYFGEANKKDWSPFRSNNENSSKRIDHTEATFRVPNGNAGAREGEPKMSAGKILNEEDNVHGEIQKSIEVFDNAISIKMRNVQNQMEIPKNGIPEIQGRVESGRIDDLQKSEERRLKATLGNAVSPAGDEAPTKNNPLEKCANGHGKQLILYRDVLNRKRKFEERYGVRIGVGSERETQFPSSTTVIPLPWTNQNPISESKSTEEMINGEKRECEKESSKAATEEVSNSSVAKEIGSETSTGLGNTSTVKFSANQVLEAEGKRKEFENGEVEAVEKDESVNGEPERFNGCCNGDGTTKQTVVPEVSQFKSRRKWKSGKLAKDGVVLSRIGYAKGEEKTRNGDDEANEAITFAPHSLGVLPPEERIKPEAESLNLKKVTYAEVARKKSPDVADSTTVSKPVISASKINSKPSKKMIRSADDSFLGAKRQLKTAIESPRKNFSFSPKKGKSPSENGAGLKSRNRFEILSDFSDSPEGSVKSPEGKRPPSQRLWKSDRILPLAQFNTVKSHVDSRATTMGDAPEPAILEEGKSKSGIAGAIAQLNLESGGKEESSAAAEARSSAHQEYLRRQNWETGNIDYMGRDSFDNIWSKICQTLEKKTLEELGGNSEEIKQSLENESGGLDARELLKALSMNQFNNTEPKPEELDGAQSGPADSNLQKNLSTGISPDGVGEKADSKVEAQNVSKTAEEPVLAPALLSAASKTPATPTETESKKSATDEPMAPSTKPASPQVIPEKVEQEQTTEPTAKMSAATLPPATTFEKSAEQKVTPGAGEVPETTTAASQTPAAPEVILTSTAVSDTVTEASTESMPEPGMTPQAPNAPIAQQIAVTKTPPTPTQAKTEMDSFVVKPVDESEKNKQSSETSESEETKNVTGSAISDKGGAEKGSAMVPYCDVFQSAKASQANEAHPSHKKSVEEIIKKQSEPKAAQFPPIPMPDSPTEAKSEAPEFKSAPETAAAALPEVEKSTPSREKSVESIESQESSQSLSRSGSMKEEGSKKKGMISKILEIVGVVPKEKKESETDSSKSVFYDGDAAKQKEKTPRRSTSRSESPAPKAAENEKEAPKTASENLTGVKGSEKPASDVPTETEKDPKTDQKAGEKKTSKKNKGKSPKPPKEREQEAEETKPSEEEKPAQVSSGEGSQTSQSPGKNKSKSKSAKNATNAVEQAKRPEETKPADPAGLESAPTTGMPSSDSTAKQSSEKKTKSQSTKISIPQQELPGTAVTMPTPPVQPELSMENKNAELLTVDESIPETPPVLPVPKKDAKQSMEKKIKGEVDSIVNKAKTAVETKSESQKPEKEEESHEAKPKQDGKQSKSKAPTEPKSGKRGSQKMQCDDALQSKDARSSGSEEVEELRAASEEGRKKEKSQATASKLSDQSLKAVPPPRRKAAAEATAPEPASDEPAETGKGAQKGKSSEPVAPPRNRSKPAPEAAGPKGKTKK